MRDSFEDRRHFFQKRDCFLHVGNPIAVPDPSDREAVSLMIKEVEQEIRETYNGL